MCNKLCTFIITFYVVVMPLMLKTIHTIIPYIFHNILNLENNFIIISESYSTLKYIVFLQYSLSNCPCYWLNNTKTLFTMAIKELFKENYLVFFV